MGPSEPSFDGKSSAAPLPPDELSARHRLEGAWALATKHAMRGANVAILVEDIERYLATQEARIASEEVPPHFDWHTDLRSAKRFHKEQMISLRSLQANTDRLVAFWTDEVQSKSAFASQVTLAGLQIMFAINGAIAVGALTALQARPAGPEKYVFIAALICAAIGLILTGAAHWAYAETLQHYASSIKAELAESQSFHKMKVLYRYMRRLKTFKRSGFVMYASILWLAVYMLACLGFLVRAII
jgi:hypothetical protein